MVAFMILEYTSYLRYFGCGGFCDTTWAGLVIGGGFDVVDVEGFDGAGGGDELEAELIV